MRNFIIMTLFINNMYAMSTSDTKKPLSIQDRLLQAFYSVDKQKIEDCFTNYPPLKQKQI